MVINMKMELIWWEINKLWQQRTWAVFLIINFAFNFILIAESGAFSEDGEYAAYVGDVTEVIGNRMGDDFMTLVDELPKHPYRERLISETAEAVDVLSGYETGELYAYYMSMYHLKGYVADALAEKYEGLQERVDALAARGASLSVGAAGVTDICLECLLYWLCPAMLTEAILFAVLLALYASGGEQMSRTQYLVYTTRRGRQIQWEKAIAALLSAEAAYTLLAGVTIAGFALSWQLGEGWRMDMASQFYHVRDLGVEMPFVSWTDFTLFGYLCAIVGLGALVILLYGLLGLCAGLVTKNTYHGFLLLLISMAFNFCAIFVTGNGGLWDLYAVMQWTPAAVWSSVPSWFSGLGMMVLVPWQDVKAVLVCLSAAAVLSVASGWRFARREVS